jgi:hypothetical protein
MSAAESSLPGIVAEGAEECGPIPPAGGPAAEPGRAPSAPGHHQAAGGRPEPHRAAGGPGLGHRASAGWPGYGGS